MPHECHTKIQGAAQKINCFCGRDLQRSLQLLASTSTEWKSTWPQNDRTWIWSWLSKQHVEKRYNAAARMPYFRCDQNADKTCSTSSQLGKLYTCHKQFWFGRRDPSLPTVGQPWIGQPTKDAVAVVIHVFPHWVNHEMRADKRFAGRTHACLPTVS